jgi:hypothetical protein
VPIYGFDEESAGRIGHTVRLVESQRVTPRSLQGGHAYRGSSGVRCMLGTIGTAAWGAGSSGTVTLYSGQPGSEASAGTLTAYNYVADIPESTTSGRYVAISNNGYGWVVIESPQSSESVTLSTASATYVVDIAIAAVQSTSDCSIAVTKTLTTASIVYATI